MAQAAGASTGFYASLSPVNRFRDLAEIERYRSVPDGATLFVADVVNSTGAIAAGRYREVNVAAAAVIAAVGNALADRAVAYSFGGDGASFVLEAEYEAVGREALAATVGWTRRELGLDLRAAAVPVSAIRAAGQDLKLARFAVSPTLSYAMFAGGGLAWAEARMKAGDFAVEPAAATTAPDLTGLTCRFAELPSRNGVILSMIVVPATGEVAARFAKVVAELLELAARREADMRPVRDGAPRLEWTLEKFLIESKTSAAKAGGRSLASLVRTGLKSALANLVMRTGRRVGGFDPQRYLTELVRNTDFRKFDDGLRMTLDCGEATADAIEALLREHHAAGEILFGTHRQRAAVLTCFSPAPSASDHVHFVDGAAGGYAYAAQALKLQRQAASFPAPASLREANKEEPMSDIPTRPEGQPGTGAPDPDAQDLAAKHDIPIHEAERIIAERGNDRGEIDAEAEKNKLG